MYTLARQPHAQDLMRYTAFLLALLPAVLHSQQDAVAPDSAGEVFLFQEVETRPKLRPGSVLYYPQTPDTIAGRVTAVVVVDTSGRIDPRSIQILASPSPAFSASARAMLLSQRYSIGRVRGKPVKVLMQQDIRFRPGTVACATVVTFEGTALCADSSQGRPKRGE